MRAIAFVPVKFEFIDSDLLDLDELDEVGDTTRSEESVFNCGGGIGAFLSVYLW